MRKTRQGVDRIKAQGVRAQVGHAKWQVDNHCKHCAQCSKAGSDVYDHCSAWWALAMDLHRLRRRQRRIEMPDPEPELALFDPSDMP